MGKLILKPIFNWKLGLRWLPNANKINKKKRNLHAQHQNFAFGTQHNIYIYIPLTRVGGFALGDAKNLH